MTIRSMLIPLILGAMSFSADPCRGDDWPRWQGPHGNSRSHETHWNPSALKNPKVLWRAQVGRGHSSVSVARNDVYTMGEACHRDRSDTSYTDNIFCLDAETGQVKWKHSYPSRYRMYPGPGATPTIDGNRLYTVGRDGDVFCFNRFDGGVIWHINIREVTGSPDPFWGFCSSAVVSGDRLLINATAAGLALNKMTGEKLWQGKAEKCNAGSPVFYDAATALFSSESMISAVNINTGAVKWQFPWNSHIDPSVQGNRILLSGGRSGRYKGLAYIEVTQQTPRIIWSQNRRRDLSFVPKVVIDGHAYGFRDHAPRGQFLQCVEVETGAIKWTDESILEGALMAAGDKLIVCERRGTVIIADASPEGVKVRSSAKILEMDPWNSYARGEVNACWILPAMAGGRLFVKNSYGEIACVDVSAAE